MGKEGYRYKRNEEIIKLIGKNIRKYRKLKGLTIEEFALLCDVSRNQMSEYELGKVNTNVTIIKLLSDKLNIHPGQLFDE